MTRLFAARLILTLFIAAGACAEVVVSGVVRSGSQAIPGALVVASSGADKIVSTSDEAGRYQFELPHDGTWRLDVQMFGFARMGRDVALTSTPASSDFTLELAARPAAAQNRFAGRGFQNAGLTQSTDDQINAASAVPPAATVPEPSDANQAFLVNGSLSRGLDVQPQNDGLRPGGFDPSGQQQSPFGGSAPVGAPGLGGGRGGFGGGPGGFGGRRGPGGPGGGGANFGNRANRNRGGIRGSAFFTLGNSAFDARPLSLTGQTVNKAAYGSARFGVVAGGALNIPKIVHTDKTYFFLNYTGTRSRSPYNGVATLPTALERLGDFSQAGTPIYDPLTNRPFPGNIVPASRMSSAALGLLPFIPLPNQPGLVQNYQRIAAVPANSENIGLRINQTLTKKDRLDANLNVQNRGGNSEQLFGFRDEVNGFGWSLALGYTHNFAHQIINSLRWNFSRNRSETVPHFAYGANVAAQLGINGVSQDPINFGPPNLSFTNFGGLSDASASLTRNQTSSLTDTVSLVKGRHSVSFGGEFRRMQNNSRTDQNGRGTFAFSGVATSAFNAQGQPVPNTGFDFADLLLGLPQSSSVRFGTNSTYFRGSVYNIYAQDEVRARSNLSFTLGLRYEYFTPLSEKYGHIANLDIAPGLTGVAVVTPAGNNGPYSGPFPSALVNPDKNNFSPRVALAWRPFTRKQVRVNAGYGIFYNGSIYNQFPSRLASQPPFAQTATLVTSTDRPLTIENGFASQATEAITNTYAVDRNYRVGYAQTWNLSVQQQLPRAFVVEVGYLGTKGTRLDIQDIPNIAAAGSRRRIGNAAGFTYDTSNGDSIYHAGQLRVNRRFSRGISFNALYTYSKSIDNASTLGGGAVVVAQNSLDLRAERGLSSFDQRHVLTLNYILTSPVGQNGVLRGHSVAEAALKDWTLSGGITAASGIPFTARVLGNQSNTAGTGSVGSGRADATGLSVSGSGSLYFNPLAFTLPAPGSFGDAGRNTIPGPSRLSLNLSLGRSFRLRDDRRRLEFRADSQNFTNRVTITSFNTIVNSTSYGLPLAAQNMRSITLTMRLRF